MTSLLMALEATWIGARLLKYGAYSRRSRRINKIFLSLLAKILKTRLLGAGSLWKRRRRVGAAGTRGRGDCAFGS
jgi:hypothetical protein